MQGGDGQVELVIYLSGCNIAEHIIEVTDDRVGVTTRHLVGIDATCTTPSKLSYNPQDRICPREGANKRGNSSRLTQSFHFFMFEPIFSPVNASNQPI